MSATKRKLVQGIFPDCHQQIDLIGLYKSFGQPKNAKALAEPIERCQDQHDCPHEDQCRKLMAGASGAKIPANDTVPTRGRTFKLEEDWANTQYLPLNTGLERQPEHMQALYGYWRERRGSGFDLPMITDIDPLRLNQLAGGKFHIIRKTHAGSYRVWRYGSEVTLDGGHNWTGLVVAEHPNRVYAHCLQSDFFEAEMLGAPMLAHVKAKLGSQNRSYDRLILPLLGSNQKTFLVGVSF